MAKNEKRLGRGLSAIFGDDTSDILEEIQKGQDHGLATSKVTIPVNKIIVNPYQPRRTFDQDKLEELKDSILQHGVLTPILVREAIHGYELIAGERRLRATKMAGLEEIPAIIVEFDDEQMMEVALIENIQREDLNVIEEARAYHNLIEKYGYTQESVAKRMNKSRSHITNLLRLLKLPEEVLEMVENDKLSMGHARPLVTMDSQEAMIQLAKKTVKDQLSVRQVELLAKGQNKPSRKINVQPKKEYEYPISLLEKKYQTKVNIKNNQIILDFQDTEDLNRILELMDVLEEI